MTDSIDGVVRYEAAESVAIVTMSRPVLRSLGCPLDSIDGLRAEGVIA